MTTLETFTLRSPGLGGQATNNEVFDGFGCSGKNISPALEWTHAPAGTRSFAITLYDPDAPTGSGFWHWLIVDIPASASSLPAGAGSPGGQVAFPSAITTRNDYGFAGYGGPCPPPGHGPHRYILTVHALDTETLGVTGDTTPAVVGFNINARTLAKASVVFYHQR